MFKIESLKSQVTALVLLQSIVSGGIAIAPAAARHHDQSAQSQESAGAGVTDATNQKLALAKDVSAQGSSDMGSSNKSHSKTSLKSGLKSPRSGDSRYQDVERYNFDMSADMPGAGI